MEDAAKATHTRSKMMTGGDHGETVAYPSRHGGPRAITLTRQYPCGRGGANWTGLGSGGAIRTRLRGRPARQLV